MDLETLSAPLEIKFATNADLGEFEGYGAFFGNVDSHGDVVVPGAFQQTLEERARKGLPPVPMHFNHGIPELGGERAVGVWKAMAEDSKGLHVRGRISGMNTDRGRHYFERVKDGAISGLSMGFRIAPNGASFGSSPREPRRLLKSVQLHEVSIVDEPSNALARVEGVKLAGVGDLETLLRRGGLSKGAARAVAAGGWPALSNEPDPDQHKAAAAAAFQRLDGVLGRQLSELKGITR